MTDPNEQAARDWNAYGHQVVAREMRNAVANLRSGAHVSQENLIALLEYGANATDELYELSKQQDREKALYLTLGEYLNECTRMKQRLFLMPHKLDAPAVEEER